MGREIRRVPANWQHPQVTRYNAFKRQEETRYQPLYDQPYEVALNDWIDGWKAWERGERPDYCGEESKTLKYWEWSGAPPDPEYYRPEWPEGAATWWQVYETVSEGTPVTPPFETQQELVEYLVANGDFWDQKRRAEGPSFGFQMPCDPWSREAAEKFVFGSGWACSFVVSGGEMMSGVEALVK